MKTVFLIQKEFESPPRGRAGMTLVEVVMALAITGLTVAGIVSGYVYCTRAAVKAELAQAANARAMERIEATRSAIWAPNRADPVDQLVASNFPDLVVSLGVPGTGSNGTPATIQTVITPISLAPPMRKIHVDCIWSFQNFGLVTNTIETIRAPDQ